MQKKDVTVIGLGKMGLKLGELLVGQDYKVTAWNRTIEKAKVLSGAEIIENVQDAIASSPLIVICVYDHKATLEIFDRVVDKNILEGKIVVNFTSSSPAEASEAETLLNEHGAAYINGAIQVAPDQMGLSYTSIFLSGDENAFNGIKDTLDVFGGNLKYLGGKASYASAMDLATLSWLYGSYVGLLYGIGLNQKAGLDLKTFSDIVEEVTPGFIEFFKHQIDTIDRKDFTVSQSPLAISVSATERIQEAIVEEKLHPEFFGAISSLLRSADSKGLGKKELASLIEVIDDTF